MPSSIHLVDPAARPSARITRLYRFVELYSEGEPLRHTLFVLGRPPLSVMETQPDQLLLVDPPPDALARFRLEGQVAALFTGSPADCGLPVAAVQPGALVHVRVGDHFLDVYGREQGAVVHLPALGIVCGGGFGSDTALPQVTPGSDGGEELETLRLLSRLVKQSLQFYIPQVGATLADKVAVMERLADDVAYLHGLRRALSTQGARAGLDEEEIEAQIEALLPPARRSPLARQIHAENIAAFAGR